MYERNCPLCNIPIVYSKKHIFVRASRQNRKCSAYCNGTKPINSNNKICTKCRVEKPFDQFYFVSRKKIRRQSSCIDCDKKYKASLKYKIKINRKTKVCSKCKKRKKSSQFNKRSSSVDNLQSNCKICQAVISAKHFQDNKKEINEKRKPYKRNYIKTPRGRFHKYTDSAKKRNIDFHLSFDEFEKIITQPCKYCGDYSEGLNISGVDRVDNNKGYGVDNCVPCCYFCNHAKSNYKLGYFVEKVAKIAKNLMA